MADEDAPREGTAAPYGQVFVVDPESGKRGAIPKEKLDEYIANGYQVESSGASNEARLEHEYGDRPLAAAAQGAASAITFGGSDVFLSKFDPEGAQQTQKHNEGAYIAGNIGGAVLSAGVGPGGLLTSAGKAAEAATVAKVGTGVGGRVAGAVVRGGTEGLGYGVGTGISQVALSDDPLTFEGAVATIGSNALGGAVLGGAIGGVGKLMSEGATVAKNYANKQVEAITKGEQAVDRGAFPEVDVMDAKAAAKAHVEQVATDKAARAADITEGKAAQKVEEAALAKARDAEATSVYKEAETFVKGLEKDARIQVDRSMDATTLGKKKFKVMVGLDNDAKFIRTRGVGSTFMTGLEEQATVLKRVLADADEVMAGAEVRQQQMLDALPKPPKATSYADKIAGRTPDVGLSPPQARQYAEWAGLPPPKAGLAINAEELAGFRSAIELGEVVHPDVLRVQQASGQLERNLAMQDKVLALQVKPTSPTLEAIEKRISDATHDVKPSPRADYIKAHQATLQEPKGLAHAIAQGAGGLVGGGMGMAAMGSVGAMAGGFLGREVGSKIFQRLTKQLVNGNASRAKAIKATIAGMFAKGADKAAKAIPYATKAIPAIQYATKERTEAMLGPERAKPSKNETVTKFRERSREINSLTTREAPGVYKVRFDALQEMHDRNAALWQIAPMVANGVEKLQKLKLEFLASKMPRNPAPPHLQVGPDTWEPGKAEMAKFYRIMDVAEHPELAVQHVAAGTATPDDVETLKTIYPSHYDEVRQQCLTHMGMLQETLPYVKRLNLSILLDVNVDPALSQEAMSVYQRPPPDDPAQGKPAQAKSLPTGMVEPTSSQRHSK